MRHFYHQNSILKDDWHKFEEIKLSPEHPMFDIETCYSGAGVLIWHNLEDSIFLNDKDYLKELILDAKRGFAEIKISLLGLSGHRNQIILSLKC